VTSGSPPRRSCLPWLRRQLAAARLCQKTRTRARGFPPRFVHPMSLAFHQSFARGRRAIRPADSDSNGGSLAYVTWLPRARTRYRARARARARHRHARRVAPSCLIIYPFDGAHNLVALRSKAADLTENVPAVYSAAHNSSYASWRGPARPFISSVHPSSARQPRRHNYPGYSLP